MKRLTFTQMLGIGLGAGFAVVALYHTATQRTPDVFESGASEFRPLTEWNRNSESELAQRADELARQQEQRLAQNQMPLPDHQKLVAEDLQLAPEMMPELNPSEVVPQEFQNPKTLGSAQQLPLSNESSQLLLADHEDSVWESNPYATTAGLETTPSEEGSTTAAMTEPVEDSNLEIVWDSLPSMEIAGDGAMDAVPETESLNELLELPEPDLPEVDLTEVELTEVVKQEIVPQSEAQQSPVELKLSESVALRAVHHIEYGKSLSRRGATQAARQEFYSALQVLAQGNDVQLGNTRHSQSLHQAILTLKEANDFAVQDVETQIGLQVSRVIETHRSQILTADETQQMSPVQAMQLYFAFASDRLQSAVGKNVVAAEAMFCLGKLHTVSANHLPSVGRLDIAKSIVYHRAALSCNPTNHRSANELGVLLARNGQLAEARDLLKQSLMIQQTPQTWKNLTKVHQRLGEQKLAQLAHHEFEILVQRQLSSGSAIEWMNGEDFNSNAKTEFHETVAARPDLAGNKNSSDEQGSASKSIADRIKGWF